MIYFNDLTERILKGLKMHCFFDAKVPNPMYDSQLGMIIMPEFDVFGSRAEYFNSFFHEVTHWTGGYSRLNRFLQYGMKNVLFAMPYEEVVAELGSTLISNEVGVPVNLPESTNFITAWAKAGQLNKKDMKNAMEDAKAASGFVFERFLGRS